MARSKKISSTRSTLLFLLFPLLSEFLFLDAIINDVYARRRIRIVFSIFLLALIAISFAASELLFALGLHTRVIPLEVSYPIVGLLTLFVFLLFCSEGWTGRVSFEEQIFVTEDRVSLSVLNPREVFITLRRILNAAQFRRYRYHQIDNSRLASYALTLLGEYLQKKVFPSTKAAKQ